MLVVHGDTGCTNLAREGSPLGRGPRERTFSGRVVPSGPTRFRRSLARMDLELSHRSQAYMGVPVGSGALVGYRRQAVVEDPVVGEWRSSVVDDGWRQKTEKSGEVGRKVGPLVPEVGHIHHSSD